MLLSKPFFTGTFDKHLVFIKRKKKKKEQIKKEREIYPLLIFKSFSIPSELLFSLVADDMTAEVF